VGKAWSQFYAPAANQASRGTAYTPVPQNNPSTVNYQQRQGYNNFNQQRNQTQYQRGGYNQQNFNRGGYNNQRQVGGKFPIPNQMGGPKKKRRRKKPKLSDDERVKRQQEIEARKEEKRMRKEENKRREAEAREKKRLKKLAAQEKQRKMEHEQRKLKEERQRSEVFVYFDMKGFSDQLVKRLDSDGKQILSCQYDLSQKGFRVRFSNPESAEKCSKGSTMRNSRMVEVPNRLVVLPAPVESRCVFFLDPCNPGHPHKELAYAWVHSQGIDSKTSDTRALNLWKATALELYSEYGNIANVYRERGFIVVQFEFYEGAEAMLKDLWIKPHDSSGEINGVPIIYCKGGTPKKRDRQDCDRKYPKTKFPKEKKKKKPKEVKDEEGTNETEEKGKEGEKDPEKVKEETTKAPEKEKDETSKPPSEELSL